MPPSSDARSETLAAVDIGTNSLHGVVARMTEADTGPRFEILEREKEMVRLGSSAGDMRELAPDAIDRAVAALDRFRQVAEVHGAPITAVATSAVREADNRDDLIDRAWDEARVSVNVISGVEEARLIHLGVLQAVPVYDRRLLLCDIGGGSTELLVGLRGEVLSSRSLKLGAIRLTRRFFDGKHTHPGAVDACRRHVRSTIAPFAREVRNLDVEVGVGSSGTIATLAEMAAMQATGTRPRSVSNLTLTTDQLDDLVADIVAAPTPEARAELPGLDASRADIILAGAIILEQVMHELGLDELVVSDYALREGVLLDTWQRRHGGSLHHLSDLRRKSVLNLAEVMDEDQPHSTQVARLALELFDADACSPRAGGRRSRDPRGGGPALQRGHVPVPRAAPQAQLLRDPRHRPADGVQRRRGRTHRARRPLPPQVRAPPEARRSSRRSTTTPSTRCASSRGCCGSRSASTATTPPGSVR